MVTDDCLEYFLHYTFLSYSREFYNILKASPRSDFYRIFEYLMLVEIEFLFGLGVFGHNCLTGDCGGGSIECKGAAGESPATLVEFSLAKDGKDFYDISLVDGFNILASITTQGSSSRIRPCLSVNCRADVNKDCPKELQVKSNDEVIACKSACLAFNQPRDCCTGEFNDPNKCKPTEFSKFFKDRCPNAYSYAYDDSSVFSCDNKPNYVITFCG